MSYLMVNGGKTLSGNVMNQTAKNSALAIICASLMIVDKTILSDVPDIEEVKRMLELLSSIGVICVWQKPGTLLIDASAPLCLESMDRAAAEKMRSSLFLFGALAAREKKYRLYKSGGCKLGARTIRPHLFALEKLGIHIVSHDDFYEVNNHVLHAADIVMYESGDTPTENAIMAAVLAPGVTTIKMASSNYMVQDLCYFLQKAGAKIKGIGTTTLIIQGVKRLRAVKNYSIIPDPIVAMTYLAAAIVTDSQLKVQNCPLDFLELELCKLEVMGQKFLFTNKRKSRNGHFNLVDIEMIPSTLRALPDKIEGRPFPGLNIDNLPLFAPILAKAEGQTLLHDWAYENRAAYLADLKKLGVKTTLLDPHRIWIEGPTNFCANDVTAPPALRPAVNFLLCMLAARGCSILRHPYEIDRGYDHLYDNLNKLGADIQLIID